MKKLFCLVILLAGCSEPAKSGNVAKEPEPSEAVISQSVKDAYPFEVIEIAKNDYGYWRLIKLKCNGVEHIYLQHYDYDCQSMVEVRPEAAR
jgi:hypothetical protein